MVDAADSIAQHAYEQVAPGFASRLKSGDMVLAGSNFGINSSREQAAPITRMMGVAVIIAPSFGRQFFRNADDNDFPVIKCDIAGIADRGEIPVDLAGSATTATSAHTEARCVAVGHTLLPCLPERRSATKKSSY